MITIMAGKIFTYLVRSFTKNSKLSTFEFKLLNNVLYLEFYECIHTNYLWNRMRYFFILTLLIFHHLLHRDQYLV